MHPVKDVPPEKLAETMDVQFDLEGATRVIVTRDDNGNYTLTPAKD